MSIAIEAPRKSARSRTLTYWLRRYPLFILGCIGLAVIILLALFAPLIATHDPVAINPAARLRPPSDAWLFGSDPFGRDVFSRVIWGGRVSLTVGIGVAALSVCLGLAIGMIAGFNRIADAVLMRIMDGMMAIPGILLAVALVAIVKPSVTTVVIAIAIPEVPRVVRLVRSVVLSIREQPYIEAARLSGVRFPGLLIRHVLPNTIAPLIVQASFVCASAILSEAYLSFLGLGIPPTTPTWGSVISEGRNVVQLAFWVVLYPSLFLGATVLFINLIGDGLRDMLDPRLARTL
ncbi:D-ala-D-ala transporter subunit; membrane component of ABC superfamily [Bosea sp. 62]|uniref:ABC transporter permease n=1 Tax=unclassified Bosea (in: a-proteobacteria) TaxID=2653178 RepID=UPI0012520CD9|nr:MULTISPECIES: ABC transporter permease [unclassified Bosea (in: a-proteobacteria)]CAD5251265.1 D-ala-D-ala transporter subunit; membrane component of ABC superfamily [Bosea sp. 7B]CAD5280820.1 D-ala-D-ala transporter subunit; membrane component of ABC superfamily [Bosea sp. 21B]CAD5281983.1 D-ala-D-ala transporter subunit; membrane component of ABC superfamily [Bosea sp. 46]VVT59384.1 D-ala-D-ala transporter subunit; membrane component of ABC superfamily [Bosea sp. EC-HK365B]VXB26871.1 D-al